MATTRSNSSNAKRSATYKLDSLDNSALKKLRQELTDPHCKVETLILPPELADNLLIIINEHLYKTAINSIVDTLEDNRTVTTVKLQTHSKAELTVTFVAFIAALVPDNNCVDGLNQLLETCKATPKSPAKIIEKIRRFIDAEIYALSLRQFETSPDKENRTYRIISPLAALQDELKKNDGDLAAKISACIDYLEQFISIYRFSQISPTVSYDPVWQPAVYVSSTYTDPRVGQPGDEALSKIKEAFSAFSAIAPQHQIGVADELVNQINHTLAIFLFDNYPNDPRRIPEFLSLMQPIITDIQKIPEENRTTETKHILTQHHLIPLRMLVNACRNIPVLSNLHVADLVAEANQYIDAVEASLPQHDSKNRKAYIQLLADNIHVIADACKDRGNHSEYKRLVQRAFACRLKLTSENFHLARYMQLLSIEFSLYHPDAYFELLQSTIHHCIMNPAADKYESIFETLRLMKPNGKAYDDFYRLLRTYIEPPEVLVNADNTRLPEAYSDFYTKLDAILKAAVNDYDVAKLLYEILTVFTDDIHTTPLINCKLQRCLSNDPTKIHELRNKLMEFKKLMELNKRIVSPAKMLHNCDMSTYERCNAAMADITEEILENDKEIESLTRTLDATNAAITTARKRKREDETAAERQTSQSTTSSTQTTSTLFPPPKKAKTIKPDPADDADAEIIAAPVRRRLFMQDH